jgi:hypothetical protein
VLDRTAALRTSGDGTAALPALLVASGAAALTYQVLWVRELGLLFGSTAQAAALAVAIFFAGLALGGWWFGRRAATSRRPLRTFGWLELAIAVTALGFFALIDVAEALLPPLELATTSSVGADTFTRAAVAAVILFPPAFLMGGTLPMATQHAVRSPDRLAVTGSALYAVNTVGSALGALAAGTVLPLALGFRGAYLAAIAVDATVGLVAVRLGRHAGPTAQVGRGARVVTAHHAPGAGAADSTIARPPARRASGATHPPRGADGRCELRGGRRAGGPVRAAARHPSGERSVPAPAVDDAARTGRGRSRAVARAVARGGR